ncbi:MAG TPA: hypothetical protein VN670_03745, partial [Acidobacteriaceae bacterium]|nr:hypothetical protein [Acidobacteriaceae bacterium]
MNPIDAMPAQDLTAEGRAFAGRQVLLAGASDLKQFEQHVLLTAGSAFALANYADEQLRTKRRQPQVQSPSLPGVLRLEENTRLLRASAMEVQNALRILRKLPFARSVTGREMPRIAGVAHALLNAAQFRWTLSGFSSFLEGYQAAEPLNLRELWNLPIALKLTLLEEILAQASGAFGGLATSDAALEASLRSLHEISLPLWSNILEPLVPFERILRDDPAGTYGDMDFDSREMYRLAIE